MQVIIKAIMPRKKINADQIKAQIERDGQKALKEMKADFEKTTKTWKHKPEFKTSAKVGKWEIKTNDKLYKYVDEGTKPHIILPKRSKRLVFFRSGFLAKTRPGWIGSRAGRRANANLTFAKMVRHPGTRARYFTRTITEKWSTEWPRIITKAVTK